MNKFGCTSPVYTNQLSKACDVGKLSVEKKKDYQTSFKNLSVHALANCAMPCSSMEINFGFPIVDKNDPEEALLKMYFKSHIHVRRNMLAYSLTSLFAEVGGYIGLLLGFSLLDLTKLVKNLFSSRNIFLSLMEGSKNTGKVETITKVMHVEKT